MPYLHTDLNLPFQSESDTSKDAAQLAERFVGPQGERVYDVILRCGSCGVTQKELAVDLNMGRPSICARVRALELAGRVVKTARRRSGCCVYEVRT